MNKLYVLKYDNGEEYDDYLEFIYAIYEYKKDAQKQMKKLDKELNKNKTASYFIEKHLWIEEHNFIRKGGNNE